VVDMRDHSSGLACTCCLQWGLVDSALQEWVAKAHEVARVIGEQCHANVTVDVKEGYGQRCSKYTA